MATKTISLRLHHLFREFTERYEGHPATTGLGSIWWNLIGQIQDQFPDERYVTYPKNHEKNSKTAETDS